jgi:prepilin-type N-terminal cleavage/methylation domain-containing protein
MIKNKMTGDAVRKLGSRDRGFSVVELLVVTTIGLILSAVAVMNIAPLMKQSNAKSAQEMVLGEMRNAHERAINERRIYRFTFVPPSTIQLEVGTPNNLRARITGAQATFGPAQPPLTLPNGYRFVALAGIPTTAAKVPDGFGSGANPVDFDIDYGGGQTQIYFQPDGRALDAQNRLNNGVVYMADPSDLLTSQAVSLYGSTGRSKGWSIVKNPDGSVRWTQ